MSNPFHEVEIAVDTPYAWKVLSKSQNEPLLLSLNNFVWSGGRTMKSICSGTPQCPEGVPGERCSCGIYCCKDPTDNQITCRLSTYVAMTNPAATAYLVKIQLYGRVIVGETGFRAGSARLVEIHALHLTDVPTDEMITDAASLEERYKVPVLIESVRNYLPAHMRVAELQQVQATWAQKNPAKPMFLADYVKLFHSTNLGKGIPADVRNVFIREFKKKLLKEAKKLTEQQQALKERMAEVDKWVDELQAYERSLLMRKPKVVQPHEEGEL